MANTSPRHMPVLGNVHPIKIENILFRDIISVFSRVFNLAKQGYCNHFVCLCVCLCVFPCVRIEVIHGTLWALYDIMKCSCIIF